MKKLLILFSIMILSGCSIGGLFSKDPEIFINAKDLGDEYKQDANAAGEAYDDKYIQITGIVTYISENKDEVLVQIYGGVACSFTSKTDSLDELKNYNKVVLNGTVEGIDTNGVTVTIKKCELKEIITEPEVVTTSLEISSLNLEDLSYKIIEVTGVAEYIYIFRYEGWSLVTEAANNNLITVFDTDFIFPEFEFGDTVSFKGAFIPNAEFSTNSTYKIFCFEVTDVTHQD